MNHKQKLGYTLLGASIMLIGMWIGNGISPNIEAQSEYVWGKDEKLNATMSTTEHGGRVDVFNNQGKNRAVMSVNEYGNGAFSSWDKNGYRQ